jgi:hypothetical protein
MASGSGQYRFGYIWTSHGGQLRADIVSTTNVLSQQRTELVRNQRALGTWGQQMRAVGTTIRYALAGAVVYGVVTAVSRLGEFEAKLGEIDALAARIGESGRLEGLGTQLDRVGDFALQTSNKFGIATADVQQFMSRFYSSFDAPGGQRGIRQMQSFTDAMAQMSLLAEGADPQALAGGIAGMLRGANLPPQEATRFVDIIAEVTRLSPVITGQDIARDIGRLAAAQTASRMRPEEIFGVYLAASMSGGSPAVIGRGITQLLASEIIRPQTEAQMAAFRQVGLPTDPTQLNRLGGLAILQRMMEGVAPGRVTFNRPGALRAEDLEDEAAIRAAGVRGVNMTLASQLFGRQESFRQFLNLLSIGGPEAIDKFIGSIDEAIRVRRGQQRVEIQMNRRWFQQLREAQANLATQVVRGFRAPMQAWSRVVGFLSGQAVEHPEATTAVAAGVIGGFAAGRVARMLGRGGMFGRRRLAGRALGGTAATLAELPATALMVQEALPNLIAGVAGTGSRANPTWVVIHPISWQLPGGQPNLGGGPGGGGIPGVPVPTPLRRAPWRRALSFLGRVSPFLGAGLLAATAGREIEGPEWMDDGDMRRVMRFNRRNPIRRAALRARLEGDLPDAQERVLRQFLEGDIQRGAAERRLARLERAMDTRASRSQPGTRVDPTAMGFASPFERQLEELRISLTPEARRLIQIENRAGVPVKQWPATRPQTRGRSRQVRRGPGG